MIKRTSMKPTKIMSPIFSKYSLGWSPFILHLLKNIVTDKIRGFSAIQIHVFDFNWKESPRPGTTWDGQTEIMGPAIAMRHMHHALMKY